MTTRLELTECRLVREAQRRKAIVDRALAQFWETIGAQFSEIRLPVCYHPACESFHTSASGRAKCGDAACDMCVHLLEDFKLQQAALGAVASWYQLNRPKDLCAKCGNEFPKEYLGEDGRCEACERRAELAAERASQA